MPTNDKYHNGQSLYNGHSFSSISQSRSDEPNNDEIDLKDLFYRLWNRKWVIICSTILFGLLAGISAFTSTPIYQSNGTLLISQPQSQLSDLGLSNGGALSNMISSSFGIGGGTTVQNELEILQSRKLSFNIADSLRKERLMPNGQQYPVIFKSYPKDSSLASQDTVAMRLRGNLKFEKVESGANVIEVTYESPSPMASGQVINIALAQYKNISTQQKRSSASSAGTFLEKERARIKDSLQTSEEELRKFMNNHKLVQVDTQTQELIKQMADLEARQQEARAKLVAANSAIKQYKKQLNSIKPGLAEQYSEAVGPDITKLQYAKSELEVKKQQLLAQNPSLSESSSQVSKLNQQIKSYKDRIKELAQNLMAQDDQYLGFLGTEGGVVQNISEVNKKLIEAQVQQSQYEAQIDVIDKQLGEQQAFFNNLPDNIVDLAKLQRDVKINEELFEAVTKQYAQTSLWEQSQFGLGRVIDDGFTPKEPIKPRKSLYILIGLILGGIIGSAYVFMGETFRSTLKGVNELKKIGLPFLSSIPNIDYFIEEQYNGRKEVECKGINISTSLATILSPNTFLAESYRRLGDNLIYTSNTVVDLQTLLLTSSDDGEGKTTTVANLGVVFAEAGYKTIMVDADFRKGALHHTFGLENKEGITEVLNGEVEIENAIQHTVVPNLSLLTKGNDFKNAAAISRRKSFLKLLDNIENYFDIVLIDTAPFGKVTDSTPLIKKADGVAVVAKFNKTTDDQLTQTLNELNRIEAPFLGTILTSYNYKESTDQHTPYSNSYV